VETLKTGRLIDHLHLRTADLEASRRFYRACLAALGLGLTRDAPDHFVADELYVDRADDAGQGPVSHVHLAFQAVDRAAVDRFHAAGLADGGRDNGAPGERSYHPGYYAAFLLDPDGNSVEAVHHGPATRSAAAVEITPGAAPGAQPQDGA
jgi:catechol 2,3-dioxygenase-like lactoylglutathione lyase family enzyme